MLVVGIDIGTESTKVVLGEVGSFEIVRNDVGGHTTPTLVALVDRQPRQIGIKSNSNTNVVFHMNRLLSGELDVDDENAISKDLLAPFYPFLKDGQLQPLNYQGASADFSNVSLLGMFLSKIKNNAKATYERLNPDASGDIPPISMALVCPPDLTPKAQQELMDAAYIAGVDHVQVLDRALAFQATYTRKFPQHVDKYVLIVDMGHADTTVSLLGPSNVTAAVTDNNGEVKEEGEEDPVPPSMKAWACYRKKGLGAGAVDVRLWQHFQSTQLSNVTPNSRGGQRLLAAMVNLKELLSQLPEGNVTVENVGPNETDVRLEGSRKLLVDLCEAEAQSLVSMVEQAMKDADIEASQLFSVEVVGGGCRMPWVKLALEKATKMSTLSYTLDDTSAAMGAALVTSNFMAKRTPEDTPTELQIALRQAEEEMARADRELEQKSSILNQMEAHILGLRSAKHERHGDLLSPELFTYLDTTEDWLFSEAADDATLEGLQAKWNEVQAKTDELSKDYKEKMESERKAKEAEMEAEAKQAQKERQGEEQEDEEDHDNRRLPKKRRMEIVMKNKKEGGELFSDGNFSKYYLIVAIMIMVVSLD
jgi:molecular chaperone DnaK (HSP70)